MNPTPKGWPRLSVSIYYDDPAKAIDWLCSAFGFETRLRIEGEDGGIMHSELVYGEAVVMVAQSGENPRHPHFPPGASPRSLGGRITQGAMLYIDNVDEHCERARAAGAKIIEEPADHDYGEEYWADRSYGALDLEGHQWWFTQRLR
jgi:uncharacterized glyoxalase superfamily protein PhnB